MSHKMLRRFIVRVSVLDYFPLYGIIYIYIYIYIQSFKGLKLNKPLKEGAKREVSRNPKGNIHHI